MNFYSCFDGKGKIIARCQTDQDINVLKKNGKTNSQGSSNEK